jgi:hypothetical protein
MKSQEPITNKKPSHIEKVLTHLRRRGSITPIKAWEAYGCYRLSSVINRLRKKGHEIVTEIIKNKDYVHAKYKLIK